MEQDKEERKRLLESSTASLKNTLKIYIYVYGDQFHKATIYKWFTMFRFFKPTRMQIFQSGRYVPKRFSEEALRDATLDDKTTMLCLYNTTWGEMIAYWDELAAYFSFKLPLDLWEDRKTEIMHNYQEIFVEFGGCFGFAVNRFDDEIIQNPRNIDLYDTYQVSDADFPGIKNIPVVLKDSPLPYPLYEIDPSYLPGHRENYGYISFTSAPYMWFGPDYTGFFSPRKLAGFKDCQENVEFDAGFRRICLWDNIAEYNAPLYRKRQWAFRNAMKLNKTVKKLNSKPFVPKKGGRKPEPSIEFFTGNFPHGGTLLAKLYVDKNGKECSRSFASACIHREMAGNTIVWQERIEL